MWVLVAVVLLHSQHCVADDPRDLALFAHLDHVLHQTIYSVPRDNIIISMVSVFSTMKVSHAACLVISKQQWRNVQVKSRFPTI